LVVNFRQSVIIAELWRPEVARPGNSVRNFCVFGKTAPYSKIFKILCRKFLPPYRSTLLCSNVLIFVRRKIGEIVRYLPDIKFRLPLKLSLVSGSRRESANCRASPQQCAHGSPEFIQIGSLSAELYSRTREHRFLRR